MDQCLSKIGLYAHLFTSVLLAYSSWNFRHSLQPYIQDIIQSSQHADVPQNPFYTAKEVKLRIKKKEKKSLMVSQQLPARRDTSQGHIAGTRSATCKPEAVIFIRS